MTRKQRELRNHRIKMAMMTIIIFALVALEFAIGLSVGYNRGFDACIQENNLYERYEQ